MELLSTVKQSDVEPGFIDSATHDFSYRHAAQVVLIDLSGRVVLLFARNLGYYKLLGGGAEGNEDILTALTREVREEVGVNIKVINEIGRVEEWRSYNGESLHQVSDAYLARVSGGLSEPNFTESEISKGFQIFWAEDIDEAIQRINLTVKHTDYGIQFMGLRDKVILEAAKVRIK